MDNGGYGVQNIQGFADALYAWPPFDSSPRRRKEGEKKSIHSSHPSRRPHLRGQADLWSIWLWRPIPLPSLSERGEEANWNLKLTHLNNRLNIPDDCQATLSETMSKFKEVKVKDKLCEVD